VYPRQLRFAGLRSGVVLCLAALAPSLSAQSRVPEGFQDVAVVSGLTKPTSMAFAPDGRLFVGEQEGAVRIVTDGVLAPIPFLTVPASASNERGLMGVAFDPDFARTGYFYVYYTRRGTTSNRVSRFGVSRANPDVAEAASERALIDGIPSGAFHNGGPLHFAADGTLLVGVGDTEVPETAQSLQVLAGKLLRVDRDGRVPSDNPFATNPSARPEIWAYGLRHPFTFAVQPGTGRIFINDVGESTTEEINVGVAGTNYGWPACEGPCGGAGDPLYSYLHGRFACGIVGAAFGTGLRFPGAYPGSYFFSDYCGHWIKRLEPDTRIVDFARDLDGEAVDLDVGPDGSLYYLSYNKGEVRRIEYVGAGNRRPVAAATATPDSGPAPLQVVLSAASSRDPDGDALTFAWDFGDASPPAAGEVVSHTFGKGPHRVRLTAADGKGGEASAAVRVQVGTPPDAVIRAPAEGARVHPGEVVRYSGEANDPDGGPLPGDALAWTVVMHHHPESDPQHHVHPYEGPITGAEGSFEVTTTLHADDIFFRIHLVATDADGLTREVTRDVGISLQP
jgi:glucose/arabinose dehydrogenase